MKKTIIATAVSAALMAPVAAQAEADVTVYGRIHQGIKLVNPEVGDSTTNFVGIGSRFGIKASSDVGNGMTASAQYEFQVDSDVAKNSEDNAVKQTRVAKVGISGGFGSVDLGHQWGAYYNLVGVHLDPTFSVGGAKYYLADGPLRTANTIKYSNSFGPVSLELDVRLDETDNEGKPGDIDPATGIPKLIGDGTPDEGGDGHAVAVSVAVNDNITLAAGVDNTTDGNSITGGAVQVSLGNYWASIAQHSVDPEGEGAEPSTTQLWVGGSFGNTSAMVGTGQGDKDMGDVTGGEPSDVTLGVYHSLGGGLGLIYEGHKLDSDGAGKDATTHLFGVRLDF